MAFREEDGLRVTGGMLPVELDFIGDTPLVLSNGAVGVEKRTPDMDVPNGWLPSTGDRLLASRVRCSTRKCSLQEASN